jgi:hypothetical protein
LNKSSNLTRQFLKKVCKVKEEHPMMKELKETDAPSDLLERLNTLFSASHDDDMRHPGMVPFDVEEIESRAGEREPGENALAARYEDRLVSAIVEANEQQEQPTVPEDVFLNKDVEHIEEHVEDIDGDIIYNAFTNVLAAGWNELLNDPGLIVRSMDEMYLGKWETGSISGGRKFKSLLARWLAAKKEKIEQKEKVIERGSIVALTNGNNERRFMVTGVSKTNGTKWFLSIKNENPSWPVIQTEVKQYHLGVREVKVTDEGQQRIEVKDYGTMEDGLNVRSTYGLLTLTDIQQVFFKVEV